MYTGICSIYIYIYNKYVLYSEDPWKFRFPTLIAERDIAVFFNLFRVTIPFYDVQITLPLIKDKKNFKRSSEF